MPKYIFQPQVDDEEWLETPPKRLWPMWCSMPYPEGDAIDRKRLLLVAALMRTVEDMLTDSRLHAVIEVAESYADGLVSLQVAEEAHDRAVEALRDTFRSRAHADAGSAAARLLYSENEAAEILVGAAGSRAAHLAGEGSDKKAAYAAGVAAQEALTARLIREVHGNPFRPVAFEPAWRSDTAVSLAKHVYESRDFSAMPILADALQDAGCDCDAVLNHCRDPHLTHVRGCWVVDLVLGKE